MIPLALVLAAGIGLALGLLGGGGSILTVPVLVSVLGMPPGQAIATSLLVVGVASAGGAIAHARRGRVHLRTGLAFGLAGMVGAFGGGATARFVPGGVLLALFALLMLVTGVAMLRGRRQDGDAAAAAPRPVAWLRVAAIGAAVGFVTGLIGAGGGFVIVPALVLFAGLPMAEAVGTSLLVVAMSALAGFAGHLGHVDLDLALTIPFTGVVVVGSLIGTALAGRVPQAAMRRVFAWFVLAVGVFLVGGRLASSAQASGLYRAVLVERWPFWVAGPAIGAFVVGFLWLDNHLLGVSTGCAELCQLRRVPAVRGSWRLAFLAGILGGGFVAGRLAGHPATLSLGGFDALFAAVPTVGRLALLAGGGVLIGFGARRAGGCTSGHAIVGVAQGARSSLVATASFLVAGFVTTQLLYGILT